MNRKDFVVDAILLIVLLMIVIGVILSICEVKRTKEVVLEVTTESTTEETTEYITEATELETIVTEATQHAVRLYDVPLDEDLQIYIINLCEEKHIDPAIVMAMAYKESTYRVDAIGDGGKSYGLLQVQPRYHYKRMQELGCTDLLDPYQNVTVAIDYLADQIERYGDLAKGLTAYNAGSYKGKVTGYAKTVMALAEEMAVM
jgi:soluble lytic murein transglycosylase-like protein